MTQPFTARIVDPARERWVGTCHISKPQGGISEVIHYTHKVDALKYIVFACNMDGFL